MKIKTDYKMTRDEFDILKKTIKNSERTIRGRKKDIGYALDKPGYVGLKLTNKCNLRCKHCYQWNEQGYHNNLSSEEQNDELSISLIEDILRDTEDVKSRLYIWGGEPLIYTKFSQLLNMLKTYKREVVICTNAILLDKYKAEICEVSRNMELLIGIEGFAREHNSIRGYGSFERAIANVKEFVKLKREGIYQGKISVHTVMNNDMIGKLYDFLTYMEEIGIDMVMLCFPWYISKECQIKMDEYYQNNFEENRSRSPVVRSWYSFDFKIEKEKIERLLLELDDICRKKWNIIIKMQPDLEKNEVEDFILGQVQEQVNRKSCLALSNRIDINPDGSVVACKFFSEFVMGNLNEASILEIWGNKEYEHMRRCVNRHLMPVCTKCSELHLHGI